MKQYKIDDGKIITVIYNDIFPYIILDENKCILKLIKTKYEFDAYIKEHKGEILIDVREE